MKALLKDEKKLLEFISDIYIFFIIIMFPFMVDSTGFFHILEFKWNVYIVSTLIFLILNFSVVFFYFLFKKKNIFNSLKIKTVHKFALVFLLINVISCFISPYFKDYDLFIGVGRGEGLITISFYVLSFLCVSLFGKFKRRYVSYFAISSIMVNTIAFLQYVGFNPFNIFHDGIGTHNVSFMATIGNVDFISAMYCILLPVSFAALIFFEDLKKYEKLIHFLSIFLGMFIIGIIDVLSGKVAFISTIVIIFPFIVLDNKRFSRFLQIIAVVLMSYCFNVIINPQYHFSVGKLGLYFQFNYIVVLFILVILALLYLSFILKKVDYSYINNKSLIKKFYMFICGVGIIGLVLVFFIDFKSGFLYEIHEIMHGNLDDNFGTYRLFLWKRTLRIFPEYPILGSGPDTFTVRFMSHFTADVASIGPLTINDTAANVYLTMLINIGIVGLISYLLFIFSQIKLGIEKMNTFSKLFLITIICFLIQDFFNLWLVIVTPVFWILMAIHLLSIDIDQ